LKQRHESKLKVTNSQIPNDAKRRNAAKRNHAYSPIAERNIFKCAAQPDTAAAFSLQSTMRRLKSNSSVSC